MTVVKDMQCVVDNTAQPLTVQWCWLSEATE
jgi:hypothetical protein